MNDRDLVVSTAMGTLVTSNMQSTYYFFPKYIKKGLNNPRYGNTRFSKNIGMVQQTEGHFVTYPVALERRLIRYKVN